MKNIKKIVRTNEKYNPNNYTYIIEKNYVSVCRDNLRSKNQFRKKTCQEMHV